MRPEDLEGGLGDCARVALKNYRRTSMPGGGFSPLALTMSRNARGLIEATLFKFEELSDEASDQADLIAALVLFEGADACALMDRTEGLPGAGIVSIATREGGRATLVGKGGEWLVAAGSEADPRLSDVFSPGDSAVLLAVGLERLMNEEEKR